MKKLLPILLAVIGVGAGIGAGVMLRPPPAEVVEIQPCGDGTEMAKAASHAEGQAKDHGDEDAVDPEAELREYVKLNNQFVVPVVTESKVEALVVLSLSVEVGPGQKEQVYAREPKLRDAFLQVLFDHANMGGFRGAFTNANNMDVLRNALNEAAHKAIGDAISDVLITEIARQDV